MQSPDLSDDHFSDSDSLLVDSFVIQYTLCLEPI